MKRRRAAGDFQVPRKRPRYSEGALAFAARYQAQQRRNYIPAKTSGELKAVDVEVAPQVNTTGSFNLMNPTVQGTDFVNRIGRKIQMKNFYVRGYVRTEASAGLTTGVNTPSQMARMIIFLDNQPNGAVPVVTDLLVDAEPHSHLNLNNRDRFRVLVDKQWVFDPVVYNTTATQALVSADRQIFAIKKFKKCNYEVIYNGGNNGTIADINTNALYMFWIGSQAAGANTDCGAVITTRVRFVDP